MRRLTQWMQVKQPQHDFIERDDFAPFLHGACSLAGDSVDTLQTHSRYVVGAVELLKYHPGLEFLGNTPEFQEKYGAWPRGSTLARCCARRSLVCVSLVALTVVVRIFYSVDRDSSGKITLRKLRRSNLLDAFNCVDEEEDINKVIGYWLAPLMKRMVDSRCAHAGCAGELVLLVRALLRAVLQVLGARHGPRLPAEPRRPRAIRRPLAHASDRGSHLRARPASVCARAEPFP